MSLSAAFDTVSHEILLRQLQHEFGVCDDALRWITSYLSGRSQCVVVNGVRSKPRVLQCGVPQGSRVGPFCFPPYTSEIGKIARKHDITVHLYADDTQLYLSFKPHEGSAAVDQMMDCVDEIKMWMEANMLKMNEAKTEYIVLGSNHTHAKLDAEVHSLKVGDAVVKSTDSARNIGAIVEKHLDMEQHVNMTVSGCYFHLRNISRIRKSLTLEAAKTLMQAFVVSKLDNLNSLLHGIPDRLLRKLQLVQNQAVRVIAGLKKYDHVTDAMKDLHWLPVHYRIDYKINLLTFKCLNGLAPSYLADMIVEYKPARSLRSADKKLLKTKKSRCKTFGDRAFSVCAPRLWNTLPLSVREKDTLYSFKKALKTHYFRKAYDE